MATPWEDFTPPLIGEGDNDEEDEERGSRRTGDALAGLVKWDEEKAKKAPEALGLPLLNLLQMFQRANFPPVAVASRPTDELLLPLPLPHALGRLMEQGIDVSFSEFVLILMENPLLKCHSQAKIVSRSMLNRHTDMRSIPRILVLKVDANSLKELFV